MEVRQPTFDRLEKLVRAVPLTLKTVERLDVFESLLDHARKRNPATGPEPSARNVVAFYVHLFGKDTFETTHVPRLTDRAHRDLNISVVLLKLQVEVVDLDDSVVGVVNDRLIDLFDVATRTAIVGV